MLMATAADMAVNPARPDTGRSTVPISAIAGEGQKNAEARYIVATSVKKAERGPTINRRKGATMISSTPCP
jgi:hypothetical protein